MTISQLTQSRTWKLVNCEAAPQPAGRNRPGQTTMDKRILCWSAANLEFAKKTFPPAASHSWQPPDLLIHSRVNLSFHVVYAKF